MTPTQFHPFFAEAKHIWLEKADASKDFDAIDDWLNDKGCSSTDRQLRRKFLFYHIVMTTPVFGTWGWCVVEGVRNPDFKNEYAFYKAKCAETDKIIETYFKPRVVQTIPDDHPSKRPFTCDLCEGQGIGYGNNPFPWPGKRCCDACNVGRVISARMLNIKPEVLATTKCATCDANDLRVATSMICQVKDTQEAVKLCRPCHAIATM